MSDYIPLTKTDPYLQQLSQFASNCQVFLLEDILKKIYVLANVVGDP